jgi:hypothetical protein
VRARLRALVETGVSMVQLRGSSCMFACFARVAWTDVFAPFGSLLADVTGAVRALLPEGASDEANAILASCHQWLTDAADAD